MPTHLELANCIRALSIDAVEKAKSGHPGMPMGMADIAEVLWRDALKHHPKHPTWCNRDRFVLSNGHGSMLLYALLHLTGYDLSIDDLKDFRQWHSKTPGHPEFREAPGVETTTGPLGQGLANAVGMALAEQCLAATYNQPGHEIVDHFTYAFVGDGCLMEGISHEVCSLAGTLGLGKLIVFYDDNGISIDGDVDAWFMDDTGARFEAYHWHVIENVDGHDPEAIKAAIKAAQEVTEQPTLICCQTIIGYGAPNKAGTAGVHGSPLGSEEATMAKQVLDWEYAPFEIPKDYYDAWDATDKGEKVFQTWEAQFDAYKAAYPELAAEYERRIKGDLPDDFAATVQTLIDTLIQNQKPTATRKSSQDCLDQLGPVLPELLGGSADLTGSNNTQWADAVVLNDEVDGNYLHYGVREFGMTGIINGIALHGGFIPFGGTFLTFSDYARNAVRLAALMKLHAIFVYSHDSIGLGEDGPTHQPIEHIASLRLIPHLNVWRPADSVETATVWEQAIAVKAPHCVLLTRQNVDQFSRDATQIKNIARGGYVLRDHPKAEGILLATGSEVTLAMQAADALASKGIHVRVVSMPCMDVFLQQEKAYQQSVLPPSLSKRVAIEAGVEDSWYRFVGTEGNVIGIHEFGASAPAEEVFKAFGFTVENVVEKMQAMLENAYS